MMCHRIGLPPISTIGLGRIFVSSARREPSPPARMPTLIWLTPKFSMLSRQPQPASGSGDTVPSRDLLDYGPTVYSWYAQRMTSRGLLGAPTDERDSPRPLPCIAIIPASRG